MNLSPPPVLSGTLEEQIRQIYIYLYGLYEQLFTLEELSRAETKGGKHGS